MTMAKEKKGPESSSIPVKTIAGKEYQGRTTVKKCIDGYIHILTIDIYCCPFEEVIVKDEKTDQQC